ncbi:MAG TPA: ankyrin repeat domain-containing protein [Candidatus Dependentiae bacterium]|nr:ankyrin repeat domain-containing protein [Candidatus Dependentiae bacterium]HRQ62917.1 ankyrin repeat domain-containing protein [Candidatus Dependentiae bacterium]
MQLWQIKFNTWVIAISIIHVCSTYTMFKETYYAPNQQYARSYEQNYNYSRKNYSKKPNFNQNNMGGIPRLPILTHRKKQVLSNPRALTILLQLREKHDISIDTPDKHGYTLLHYACIGGFTNATHMLLQAGANPHTACGILEEAPLIFAIINNHKEIIELLLTPRPNPHNPSYTWRANPNKKTIKLAFVGGLVFSPLHWAIKFGRENIIPVLLDYGADHKVKTNRKPLQGLNALGLAYYYYNQHTKLVNKKIMLRIAGILEKHIQEENNARYYHVK